MDSLSTVVTPERYQRRGEKSFFIYHLGMTEWEKRWERRQAAARRRKALREQAITYKGGSCRICGYSECLAALEFHHVESFGKEFNISDRMTSFDAIRAELDKCVLLCCRCHREVHDGMHPGYMELDERGGWEYDLPDDADDGLGVPIIIVGDNVGASLTVGELDSCGV